jgi:hypothetical protein
MFLDVAVYREIVKQLKRDGFIHIADELTHSAFIPSPVTFTDGINISKCLKQAISEGIDFLININLF